MSTKTKNFHPILFSTPMVKALLNGTKTQTRRIVKLPNYHPSVPEKQKKLLTIKDWILYDGNNEEIGTMRKPYKEGDVLWVRETFRGIEQDFGCPRFEYKATENINLGDKWKPSIFMPKEACRIFLKVKSIRIERLQDISEEDAKAEGVLLKENGSYINYLDTVHNHRYTTKAKSSFQTLWHSINGPSSWIENPYVFAYEFEKIEKPLDFIV